MSNLHNLCQCNLRKQLREAGYDGETIRLLDESIDDRTDPWDALEQHLRIEEEYILPLLSPNDRVRVRDEHATLRGKRASGEEVPEVYLRRHAGYERELVYPGSTTHQSQTNNTGVE